MSNVNVNYGKIKKNVNTINQSLNMCNRELKEIKTLINDSHRFWQGEDQQSFQIIAEKRIFKIQKMYTDLSHFSSYLSYSYDLYRNLSIKLQSRAKTLP